MNYTQEVLMELEFHFKGKVMSFDEAAAALGMGGNSPESEKARVINLALNKPNAKIKVVGQKKPTKQEVAIADVHGEMVVEDTITMLTYEEFEQKKHERFMAAEDNGEEIFPVKLLEMNRTKDAIELGYFLNHKGIQFDKAQSPSGKPMLVIYDLTESDLNAIEKKMARMMTAEKVGEGFDKTVGGLSTTTKTAVAVTGKVTEGAVNIVTATAVQTGKSVMEIGAGAYVSARDEYAKQRERAAMNPEMLEAGLAVKRGFNAIKAKFGFGGGSKKGSGTWV